MTKEVKLQTPTSHQARGFLQTSIPFLDTNIPDAYKTSHQADFQPLYSQRTEPCPPPRPTQIYIRDRRYIKDFLTETTKSFMPHKLPQIIRIPNWTNFTANFRLETGPQDGDMHTTESQQMQPHPVQPRQACIRPANLNLFNRKEKLPGSTTQTTFIPHHGSPLVKAKQPKNAAIFPTLGEDGRRVNFVSLYEDSFQEHRGSTAPHVIKPSSFIRTGDPTKNMEKKTNYSVSFIQPPVCSRPQMVKEHTNLRLGGFYDDAWSSTSREDFCYPKLEEPFVRIKRNPSVSSVLKGDTDKMRNKERMSTTTTKTFFSNLKGTHQKVSLPALDLITRSHFQISYQDPSGFSHTTTAKEHYGKKDGARCRPVVHLDSIKLNGPERGPNISVTKTDFLPLKISKTTACESQHKSHIWFPPAENQFSTITRDDDAAKPLTLQRPAYTRNLSHFTLM